MLQWQQSQRMLEVLASLSYRTGELDSYLQAVATGVSELLQLDWAIVTLCAEGREQLLASNLDLGHERHAVYDLHGTVTGTVIKTGTPVVVEDTDTQPQYGEVPEGYRSYLGVPLRTPTGKVIGTICSFQRSPRHFAPEEVRLAEIFAERAATAIDNYHLFQQQKQFNQILKSEKERFRKIFDHSNDAILVMDPDCDCILEANPQACRMLGYTRDELLSSIKISDLHPQDMSRFLAFARSIYAEGQGWMDELTCCIKGDREILIEVSASNFEFAGRPCIIAHGRDITERKLAESALLERERLAALSLDISMALTQGDSLQDTLQRCADALVKHLEGTLARIWTFQKDENVLVLQASSGLCASTIHSHQRIPVGQLQIGWIAEHRKPFLTNSVLGSTCFEYQDWFEQESLVAFAGYPLIMDDELVGVMAMFARRPLTDATLEAMSAIANGLALGIDRKQSEIALIQSEEQLRQLAENLHQIFWMQSYDGKPIYLSPVFEDVWGIACEAWYTNPSVWLNAVHPDDREWVEAATQTSLLVNSDIEFRMIRPDGAVRIIRNQSFPIRDQHGTIYRIAGIAEDITDRKRSQEEMLKALERLAEIGELAAMIVHEVRNPLTTVMMGLTALRTMELPERMQMRLDFALDEAERLKRLLNEILVYARPQTLERSPVCLQSLVAEMMESMRPLPIAQNRRLDYAALLPPVTLSGDADKLKQVLINLVTNALEAIPEGDVVTCRIQQGNASNQVCIQIHNGGEPIPPDILPQLTKPFLTTKPDGNGLGLAITKRIVEAHGGTLTIQSSAASGTTVTVELPIMAVDQVATGVLESG